MKKLLLLIIPAMIQLILIPMWFLKIDYRYIDASIISMVVCVLTPIYLLIINLIFKGYQYGIVKIHLIMLAVVILGVVFSMIGWSRFDIHKILHPDGLTAGFNKFFLQFGGTLVVISFIVSYITKLVKK